MLLEVDQQLCHLTALHLLSLTLLPVLISILILGLAAAAEQVPVDNEGRTCAKKQRAKSRRR